MTGSDMENEAEQDESIEYLIYRLRELESDHAPDGYPPVTMAEVSALLDEIDILRQDLGAGRRCPDCGEWIKEGWIHGCG